MVQLEEFAGVVTEGHVSSAVAAPRVKWGEKGKGVFGVS